MNRKLMMMKLVCLESGADTVQPKPLKVAEFSPEELERFENRFENGYDIFTDEKYVAWLRQYHPDSVPQDLCDNPLNTTLNDPFNESPFDEHDYQPDGDGNFSQEELECFEKWFENGYDIFTDVKYVAWLQEYQLHACLLQLVHWKSLQHYLIMNQV